MGCRKHKDIGYREHHVLGVEIWPCRGPVKMHDYVRSLACTWNGHAYGEAVIDSTTGKEDSNGNGYVYLCAVL
jgi:hypothetical protein